jgi:hypothetical protein
MAIGYKPVPMSDEIRSGLEAFNADARALLSKHANVLSQTGGSSLQDDIEVTERWMDKGEYPAPDDAQGDING